LQPIESSSYAYSPPASRLQQNRWLRWGLILAIWVVLGVIFAAPYYVEVRSEGMNHSPLRVFFWAILSWGAWALLTPVIVWLGRRYSFVEKSWKQSLAVHIPAFIVISAIHSAIGTYITLTIQPFANMGTSPNSFWPRFVSRFQGSIGSDLLVYAGILGVCYAIDYYRKYREREFRATQLESQLAQAQLDSLRMQLQPHFLFNTLNNIVSLVRDNKNETAIGMLVGLSDLLRHALVHSDKQEVALKEEVEFVQLYLKIQQMRFSDRLRVETNIDPATLKALVPSLLLQPLAENALKHGLSQSGAAGMIRIESHLEKDELHISISDDGAGLPDNWQLKSSGGIGLANTIARLEQLYDAQHKLDIHNRSEGGVVVSVVIPFHTSRQSLYA
jgi:two-component system, LytTR family, sensor kinase